MPLIQANGGMLNYELTGPTTSPVVAFSNSLGTTHRMWDAQVAALAGPYRCLRYDTRGHGQSPVRPGEATIDDLAEDLAALLDALAIDRVHLVGLSLGGMTAQAFALRHPGKLDGLVLMATAAYMPSDWQARAAKVRAEGTKSIADATMTRWFTADAIASPTKTIRDLKAEFEAIDKDGYADCCLIIDRMDLRPRLSSITAPTLIIAGADDPATPVAKMEEIRASIPDAELVIISRAAHMLAVERPVSVNRYLRTFLDGLPRNDLRSGLSSFEAGLANRKAVLGNAHVERSLSNADEFSMPWQDFITRMAWGEIWGDAALPWKTRSLVTLAMMVALHREEEFKLHVRPAIKNGVTLDELRSLLLQTSIYAGVPAANAAFRWVRDVVGDIP